MRDASCPTCDSLFERLLIDYNEDGTGYALLEVKPCAGSCGKLLCPCCDQFACDGCGDTFCADHLVSVEDGTETPLHCCPTCASECEVLPMPFPPQSEREEAGEDEASLTMNRCSRSESGLRRSE